MVPFKVTFLLLKSHRNVTLFYYNILTNKKGEKLWKY